MRLLAFAILVACVQSVCAQSILKDPKELSVLLNEVVVTGTGTERRPCANRGNHWQSP